MSLEEFRSWARYNAESPIDDLYTYHMPAARICMVIANAHRDPKKHPQPFELKDFLPDWWDLDPDGEPATPIPNEAMREKLEQVREYSKDP